MANTGKLLAIYDPIARWQPLLTGRPNAPVSERQELLRQFSLAMDRYQPRLVALPNCEALRATASQRIAAGAARIGQERDLLTAAWHELGDALWGHGGSAAPRA